MTGNGERQARNTGQAIALAVEMHDVLFNHSCPPADMLYAVRQVMEDTCESRHVVREVQDVEATVRMAYGAYRWMPMMVALDLAQQAVKARPASFCEAFEWIYKELSDHVALGMVLKDKAKVANSDDAIRECAAAMANRWRRVTGK